MTRKILSLLVAALMVLAIVPLGAFAKSAAAEEETFGIDVPRLERQLGGVRMSKKTSSNTVRDAEYVNNGSVYATNFENGYSADGWWLCNKDNDTGDYTNWTLFGGSEAHSGSRFMGSYSHSNVVSSTSVDNWLITPELTIPNDGNTYYLTYWASSYTTQGLDKLQIMIAEAGTNAYNASSGTVTTSRWTSIKALADVPAEWTCYDVDLSAYAGKTVSIAFRHKMTSLKYVLLLDDVSIGQRVEVTPETSVVLNETALDLTVTETAQLTATVAPDNATFTDVTWSTSNTAVVAVNGTGGIMALAAGTATITATTYHGLTATCTVTVTEGDYSFDDTMQAFAVADYDQEAYVETWYGIDQYGELTQDVVDGSHYILVSEYSGKDGVIYAYVGNLTSTSSGTSIESVDFASFDPADDYAMTLIEEGVEDYPDWMAYDFDTGVMYGGLFYKDDLNAYHSDIMIIDVATGTMGETIVDVFNETIEYGGETYQLQFVPYYATCIGDGWFVTVDANYDSFILYVLDYQGTGFQFSFIGDYDISEMVGDISTYSQKIWYNPFDDMVYWAADFGSVEYVILDVNSGIAVSTGIVGPAGATYGCGITALYTYYLYDPTAVETYTVTYTINGEEYAVQEYEAGETITPPEFTVPEGYTFSGWKVPETMPEEDITVDATLTINTYTVTFVDWDGTVLDTQTVEYGSAATAPADPSREGYTFTGWDADFSSITGDLTVTAQYTINTYTVTFVDWDGTVLDTQTVEYGGSATAPADPTREGYTFIGWDVAFDYITGNLTVTAQYEEDVPPVTILLGDVDCNGEVNMADLALASSYVQNTATVTAQGILNGDINGDGLLTIADLAGLYNVVLG